MDGWKTIVSRQVRTVSGREGFTAGTQKQMRFPFAFWANIFSLPAVPFRGSRSVCLAVENLQALLFGFAWLWKLKNHSIEKGGPHLQTASFLGNPCLFLGWCIRCHCWAYNCEVFLLPSHSKNKLICGKLRRPAVLVRKTSVNLGILKDARTLRSIS